MPMPTPHDDEDHDKFMNRCMGDDVMTEDFDDPAQRRAVCERQWEGTANHEAGAVSSQGQRSYEHISRLVLGEPWALLPAKYAALRQVIAARLQGGGLTGEELEAVKTAAAARGTPAPRTGAVAILPLYGVLSHRANLITEASGGTSMQLFGRALQEAIEDDRVSSIVIDVDSPGGMVAGTPELADQLYSARGRKPIVAIANTLMASAAYWVASQADEIVVSPSAQVGSVGIIAEHIDESKAMEKQGFTPTILTTGDRKADMHPYFPLSAEARVEIERQIEIAFSRFVADVGRGRGLSAAAVRTRYGDGRLVQAQEAVDIGLADRIGTLEATVTRLVTRAGRQGGGAAAALQELGIAAARLRLAERG